MLLLQVSFRNFFNSEKRKMKVTDVEQDYLGYAVHWPAGIPVTDQHTEIEIGAEESERGKEVRCGGLKAGGGVVEEVVKRGTESSRESF